MSTISAGTTSTTTLVATGDTTGSLVFKTNDTGSGGTTAMTIDTSQNVGIGTSSPAASLSITKQSTALSGTGNSFGVYLYPTSTGQCWLDGVTNSSSNTSMGIRSYNNGTYYTANLDNSGNFQFNSGYGSTATAYGCRAWVNFNGTGTVAIRASGNVSSITDNGTGDYTVNFTTALADANYSGVALFGNGNTVSVAPVADIGAAPTTSTFRALSYLRSTGAAVDVAYVNVSVFR